ncbi:hypothetical protein FB45DRAFT_874708 [Roridomyces roridus]|uniref:Uncharacterized protein n=1 Tax=Roridomyces roridus TaxID=1738132 RepID=A0AAD7B8G4_9AGAR|nr:hypothetical protein FB45DRAFT_874708 [Roridomyces roridus]
MRKDSPPPPLPATAPAQYTYLYQPGPTSYQAIPLVPPPTPRRSTLRRFLLAFFVAVGLYALLHPIFHYYVRGIFGGHRWGAPSGLTINQGLNAATQKQIAFIISRRATQADRGTCSIQRRRAGEDGGDGVAPQRQRANTGTNTPLLAVGQRVDCEGRYQTRLDHAMPVFRLRTRVTTTTVVRTAQVEPGEVEASELELGEGAVAAQKAGI